jgi:hypothetical protein
MVENDNKTKEPSIKGAYVTGKSKEKKGELETPVRIDGELAGVIRQAAIGPTEVTLNRTKTQATEDQVLWATIRNRTRSIGFDRYYKFIDRVLCNEEEFEDDFQAKGENKILKQVIRRDRRDLRTRSALHGIDSYNLLKLATEAFLIFECGLVYEDGNIPDVVLIDVEAESRRFGRSVTEGDIVSGLNDYLINTSNGLILPYLDRIITQIVGLDSAAKEQKLPYCEAVLRNRLTCPSLLELIWSYWQEQGALAMTMNVITLRFQNKRWRNHDPLANMELDPLRPLNHILWGFIQDEASRLSLQRRAYEYDHHYGLILLGKAVPRLQSADSRSNFLEAFHNLLHRTALFYREDDDTTVLADAFPLLNSLREVHLILAEGAHNQYGDLPWTARREMLIMQWILARPETKDFLRGRYMVPYQEPWMGAVDDMKRLQGWDDVTVTHYHELAVCGEQILLSVRFGDWIDINDQEFARNWARYWRPEIQRYIHAYNAVTGVDLSADVADVRLVENRYVQPAVLMDNRSALNRRPKGLPLGRRTDRRLLPPRGKTSLEIDYTKHALVTRRGE